VTASKELTVAEQPQQLITIEPAKYVELVFEPFAKRLADAKTLAAAAKFDVTTTAGMAVAVKYRATFREIRVASEKARKERKAPILEIGKLLDSRQKEIEAEIEPFESRFDAAIKAEEKRKDDEKIARALAESTRIAAISERISFLRDYVSSSFGLSAAKIAAMIETLEAEEITLEAYAERSGEAGMTKIASLEKMRDMHATQVADEEAAAEAARQAEADRIERERVAEANRIEAKRLADLAAELERQAQAAREKQAEADRIAREQREAAEREQQAANERAAAAMRQQQAEHDARMAEQRAQLEREQAAWNRSGSHGRPARQRKLQQSSKPTTPRRWKKTQPSTRCANWLPKHDARRNSAKPPRRNVFAGSGRTSCVPAPAIRKSSRLSPRPTTSHTKPHATGLRRLSLSTSHPQRRKQREQRYPSHFTGNLRRPRGV
jgi:hypothetical protein